MTKKIDKVIHYCWFGNGEKTELIKKCIASWKKFCPDYEIIEWNEENFDVNMISYTKEAYSEKKWAFVTDYARLWIVYNFGGIYLDTDVELISSLDSLLNYDAFFSCENSEYIATGLGFGAKKKNSLIYYLMKDYEDIHFILGNNKYDLTPCPIRNTKTIRKHISFDGKFKKTFCYDNICILPTDYFCPYNYESGKIKYTNNTLGVHWYGASWLDDNEKYELEIKRKFLKFGILGKVLFYIFTFIKLLIYDRKSLYIKLRGKIKKR